MIPETGSWSHVARRTTLHVLYFRTSRVVPEICIVFCWAVLVVVPFTGPR